MDLRPGGFIAGPCEGAVKTFYAVFCLMLLLGCAGTRSSQEPWEYAGIKVGGRIDSTDVRNILKQFDDFERSQIHSIQRPADFPSQYLMRVTDRDLSRVTVVHGKRTFRESGQYERTTYIFRLVYHDWILEDRQKYFLTKTGREKNIMDLSEEEKAQYNNLIRNSSRDSEQPR